MITFEYLTRTAPVTVATHETTPYIAGLMPFKTYGAMSAEKHVKFIGNKDTDDIRFRIYYTVYSYSEAIADVTVEVDEYHNILNYNKSFNPRKYSRTTSKHQGYARRALDLIK
jgi:hypothetical protein